MSKTIEEAIQTYAKMCGVDNEGYTAIEQAVRFGVELHKSLPLADRLTDTERERIKEIYNDILTAIQYQIRKANFSMNRACKDWHNSLKEQFYARLRILESIFGKEMFNEVTDK